MSETWFTALYCGMGNVIDDVTKLPSVKPVTVQLNFEHFARTYLRGDVQCGGPNGLPTGAQRGAQQVIVERHGSFGFVSVTVDTGTQAKWQQAHPRGKSALNRVEIAAAPTLAAARIAAADLREQVRFFLDKAGVPNAPTQRERAVNFLTSLNLANAHPGFDVVRDSYVDALNDVQGVNVHHWLWRDPFRKAVEPPGWPIDGAVIAAMLAELDAAQQTDPRRVMQYALMYGGLAMVLDSPVT